MLKRYNVYKDFEKYKQTRDDRNMDEICSFSTGFELQVQQSFLRDYISKHQNWRSLLLYHQIGSGKTCSSITLAERYMDLNPNHTVIVILPARLRTNFIDELISPCGMDRYISAQKAIIYHSDETPPTVKSKIRKEFMTAIQSKYKIMSFEVFRKSAFQSDDLNKWVQDFTRNKMIIVDEVHNLISNNYNMKIYNAIEKSNRMIRAQGSGSMLFTYLNNNAHPSCKMLYLTATPVFDNIAQFHMLIRIMNPNAVIPKKAFIKDVTENLRGKVSFFPGTSANAYPRVKYIVDEVVISNLQDNLMLDLQAKDKGDEDSEAFMVYQRMVGVACLLDMEKITKKNYDVVLSNLNEYAPKIKTLLKNIKNQRGKHIVYSTFVQVSIGLIEQALRREGWVSWKEPHVKDKVYAIWDGSVKDEDKLAIKAIVNSKKNMTGESIRLILGSPSIKEGVSFKHVQHLHLLDPVWNTSAKNQIEGRAVRFCSHVDVPHDHPWMKREVQVHLYKCVSRRGGMVKQTADELIYNIIIPKKTKLIEAAENALKKVSIDYHLFKKMYVDRSYPSTPNNLDTLSALSIEDDAYLREIGNKKPKKCPKKQRPLMDDECPPGMILKNDVYNNPCCYKEKNIINNKTCPKSRRPVIHSNGTLSCDKGYVVKNNKHGDKCCYKQR